MSTPQTDTTTTVTTTTWITPREATQAIAQGSWAVLLFVFVVSWFLRKHLVKYMGQQVTTMQATAEAVRFNSNALRSTENHMEELAGSSEMNRRMTEFVAKKVVTIADQTAQIAKDIKEVKELLEK
jgi:hypothetical protein